MSAGFGSGLLAGFGLGLSAGEDLVHVSDLDLDILDLAEYVLPVLSCHVRLPLAVVLRAVLVLMVPGFGCNSCSTR